jgi:exonuclease SbcC
MIDFNDPQFTQDKLFVITGPTGSGKTTILDAICMAIYGETPRLGAINTGMTEIMSRNENECFAEVVFEVSDVSYLSVLSLKRSAKTGKVAKKEELAIASTGDLLEAAVTAKKAKIKEITGMDFFHFTRSILLAQGAFAAFLSASPSDRSPILERITGTDIYSRFSKFVYLSSKDEEKKLDLLKNDLLGLALLSPEEELELKAKYANLETESPKLANDVKEKNAAVIHLKRVDELNNDLKILTDEKVELIREMEEFSLEDALLARALAAFEIEGEYLTVRSLRDRLIKNQHELEKIHLTLPAARMENEKFADLFKESEVKLDEAVKAQSDIIPVLIKVREKDTLISGNALLIKNKESGKIKITVENERLNAELASFLKEMKIKRDRLNDVVKSLQETKDDEALIEKLSGMRQESAQYLQMVNKRIKICNDIASFEKARLEKRNSMTALEKPIETNESARLRCQDGLKIIESELLVILKGKDIAYYHGEKDSLEKSKFYIDDIIENLRDLNTYDVSKDQKIKDCSVLKDKIETVKVELTAKLDLLEAKVREIELLEENHKLSLKILSFNEHRANLTDGSPCPLCGSLEHPYAAGNTPVLGEGEQKIAHEKKERLKLERIVQDLQKQEASDQKELAILELNINELNVIANQKKDKLFLSLNKLHLSIDDPGLLSILEKRKLEIENQQITLDKIISKSAQLEINFKSYSDALKDTYEEGKILAEKLSKVKEEIEKIDGYIEQSRNDLTETETALEYLKTAVNQSFSLFGHKLDGDLSVDRIFSELEQRMKTFQNLTSERLALEKDIGDAEARIRETEKVIKDNIEKINEAVREITRLNTENADILAARRAIFGDKIPDQEENGIRIEIERAMRNKSNFQKQFTDSTSYLKALEAQASELGRITLETETELLEKEKSFSSTLNKKGFTDETVFLEARLSEERRRELQDKKSKFSERKTKIESLLFQKSKDLALEKDKNLTQLPLSTLEEELSELQERQKTLQENIGSLKQRLQDNEKLKVSQSEKIVKVRAQESVYQRYEALNKRIGSSDGEKFRSFAQSLAFDLLVRQANIQLRKMSGRYLLCQDHDHPLEFNVVDNFQGGLKRPTSTLSGGESFIVSLSLALGLSFLSSENVQMDSLFLDEGFGSLDEEALDIAVSTLAELPRVEGKTIGLISHVGALTDRIGTQIKVIPRSGGKSVLEGPGCRRLG